MNYFGFSPLYTPLSALPAAAGWLHYAMLEFHKYREIVRDDDDVIVWLTGGDHQHHPGREIGILQKIKINKRYCCISKAFVFVLFIK